MILENLKAKLHRIKENRRNVMSASSNAVNVLCSRMICAAAFFAAGILKAAGCCKDALLETVRLYDKAFGFAIAFAGKTSGKMKLAFIACEKALLVKMRKICHEMMKIRRNKYSGKTDDAKKSTAEKTASENGIIQMADNGKNKEQSGKLGAKMSGRSRPCCFCTIAGKEYLLKVMALQHSLMNNARYFQLWICCIDDTAFTLLSKLRLENVCLLKLEQIEDDDLLSIRGSRKINEYCWTLKAPLIRHILDNCNVPDVIYCDSDIYFFSDPAPIYEEWGSDSVYLCPQRDRDWVEAAYGKYQAGLIGFKNDATSKECLSYWKKQCIEWCSSYADTEKGRFGDQKYLDDLPRLYKGIKISAHLGVDAAPWNTVYNNNYNIESREGNIFIEGFPLIAFHFATIAVFDESQFDLWTFNRISIQKIILDNAYIPYLTVIRECIEKIRAIDGNILNELFSRQNPSDAKTYFKYSPEKIMLSGGEECRCFCTIVSSEYMVKGLLLYDSLKRHAKKIHFWICCADSDSYSILKKLNLPDATLINVSELEDEEIKEAVKNRKFNEFCWTLKAPLVQYIFSEYDIESVIYCDADLYFFSDPKPVFDHWLGHSVYICRQRDNYEFEKVHGGFQAGFIGFRNDRESKKILSWWRQKCIDWCFDDPQPQFERWGDQKYLDKLPMLFSSIKIENSPGINAAPWNIVYNNNYNIRKQGENVYIENAPLVFYHFGSMRFYNENEYDLWKLRPLVFDEKVIEFIYKPYLKEAKEKIKAMKPYIKKNSKLMLQDISSESPMNYFKIQ